MRPLSSNLQGYSASAVQQAMKAGTASFGCRIEVYDQQMNRLPDIDGIIACHVTYDEAQEVKHSLALTMLPYEALRNAPLQFWLRVLVQIGPMPDSGVAELPIGTFLWTRPKRTITGVGTEEWNVTLGDLTHLLQLSGPHEEPYVIDESWNITQAIRDVLWRAGLDWGRIDVPLTWDYTTSMVIYTFDASMKWPWGSRWGDDANAIQAAGGVRSSPAQTWLAILRDLHASANFEEPTASADGFYSAHQFKAWDTAPPDASYTSDAASIVLPDATTEPDLSRVCNYVKGWAGEHGTSWGDLGTFHWAFADLNEFWPTHPLAQATCGYYIDRQLPDTYTSTSFEQIRSQCVAELFRCLAQYEKLEMRSVGFEGVHEAYELIAVRILDDAELAPTMRLVAGVPKIGEGWALFRETNWDLDCVTGEMTHTLSRLFRLLSDDTAVG